MGFKGFMEQRKEMLERAWSEGIPHLQARNRMRGQTTSIALRCISDAMLVPGCPVECVDHIDNQFAHDHLIEQIKNIIHNLNLEGFQVTRNLIVYHLE